MINRILMTEEVEIIGYRAEDDKFLIRDASGEEFYCSRNMLHGDEPDEIQRALDACKAGS